MKLSQNTYDSAKLYLIVTFFWSSRDGAVVRALAPHLCDPGFDSRTRDSIPALGVILWVEFIVGSLLCSERFSSGNSGISLF